MLEIFKCSAKDCRYTTTIKANFTRHKNSHKWNCRPRTRAKKICPITKCQWNGYESNLKIHLKNRHR